MQASALLPRRRESSLTVLITLAAGLWFGSALSDMPVAGESAHTVALHAGLMPAVPLLHPLWGLIVYGAAWMGGPFALLLNVLSALCAGLAMALFFRLMRAMLPAVAPRPTPPAVTELAALAATATLALLAPIVYVATRAHPGAWELLALLTWFTLLHRWWCTARERLLVGVGAVTGLIALDITAFPLLAVPVLALVLVRAWRLTPPPRRVAVLGGVLGLTVLGAVLSLGLAFIRVWLEPAYAWRTDLEVGVLLRAILGRQALLTREAALGFGWLLPTLTCFLPSAGAWLVLRRLEERPPAPSRMLATLVMAGCSALLLLNVSPAPWGLLPTPGGFRIACLAASLTVGLAILLVYHDWRPRHWPEPHWRRTVLTGAGVVMALLVGGSIWRQDPRHAPRATRPLYLWARETIHALDGRPILVTDGMLDSLLALAARESRQSVTLLDLSRGTREAYLPFIAAQCPTPELQALAQAGLAPVLREWMRARPDAPRELALLSHPDPWLAAGLAAIPHRTLYLGTRAPDAVDPLALLDAAEAVVERLEPPLRALATGLHAAAPLAGHLLEGMGRQMNNLGIALENLHAPAAARRAYARASALQPENVCSAINQLSLQARAEGGAGGVASDAALEAQLRAFASLPLSALTARFGHVRDAAAVALLRPDLATRASPPMRPATRAALRPALTGDWTAAAAALDTVLASAPEDRHAWVLRGLVASRARDGDTLALCMQRLHALGQESVMLLVAQARLEAAAGAPARARKAVTRALALAPDDGSAQATLLALALADPEAPPPSALVARILARDPGDALANHALGLRLYREGQPLLAEAAFRRSLARRLSPDGLNNLAWILNSRGDAAAALPLAELAVQLAPGHTASRDTLAVIHAALSATARATENRRDPP